MLGFVVAAAAAWTLAVWLGREGSYWPDELAWFGLSPNLNLSGTLDPHYGHLIAVPRLLYKAILESFGSDYVYLRILHPLVTIAAAGLFFVYARRRVGSLVALAAAILLMFFGADWHNVVVPIGITVVGGVAFGLAALVALDRGDRRGDLLACAALCLGAATFTNALPYLAAVALIVAFRPDRASRLWVVAIPGLLYAAWLVTAGASSAGPGEQTSLSNLLLAPQWAFESLSIVLAAFSGLGYSFHGAHLDLDPTVGYPLAVLALAALAWRLRGADPRSRVVALLAVPAVYWALGSLASGIEGRAPDNPRYLFAGAVAVLLAAVEASTGLRPHRRALTAIGVITVIALMLNIALLRDGATFYRNLSGSTRAALSGLELAGDRVDADFDAGVAAAQLESAWDAIDSAGEAPTGAYLEASRRYGSPAYAAAELAGRPEAERGLADNVLVAALGLELTPSGPPPPDATCRPAPSEVVGGATVFVSSRSAVATPITIRRFADADTVDLGNAGRGWSAVAIPPDAVDQPWVVAAGESGATICIGAGSAGFDGP